MLTPKIIFEDDSLFVVEKPSGWITNEASTTTKQPVLQTWIKSEQNYPLKGDYETRDGIVHRLDKETSGIILIAKTKDCFENLQKQFKDRVVQKTYTALVHGEVKLQEGMIDASVGRLPWRRDRFGILPGGREAMTLYKLEKRYRNPYEQFSLLSVTPKTGRTHQIRIHLKHIGHPIVADNFYAGRKTARNDRKWCSRLFLHAGGIAFQHPVTFKLIKFESKLPQDLTSALESLELIA